MKKSTRPLLVLATGNPGKVAELQHLLRGVPIEPATATDLGLALPADEPYATFLENAKHKALFVAEQTPLLVLGEDSGLEVDALGGKPGVLSKRYSGLQGNAEDNNTKLLRELREVPRPQRMARFQCVAALAAAGRVLFTASGACEGLIADDPRGTGGFGYDPLFYLPDKNRTMAELSAAEKNHISHRSRALEKVIAFIRQYASDA
ncbi:MAG: RdgB/HAM1 family non-canonical purine NTP pyrophosphatase [Chloroflexota bacterium]|nr:RdgB/HAM1 family non-canonical purine NTP pyrophosphatase [Chloroflexota bacterium]